MVTSGFKEGKGGEGRGVRAEKGLGAEQSMVHLRGLLECH